MRTATLHETTIMFALIGGAAVVFIETAPLTEAQPGQIAPALFPRLAAGAVAAMAMLRIGALVLGHHRVEDADVDWSWSAIGKPLLSAVLIIGYYLAFDHVPFIALTALFLVLTFWVYGVRPWYKNLLNAAVATGFFWILFLHFLRIPV